MVKTLMLAKVMMMKLQFSIKQMEYIANATKRWNFKIGATQCGKTYVDVAYVIPSRIRALIGKSGLIVIMGVSKGTIERNVLQPMRDIWGDELVGTINSQNMAELFGRTVYCLGAENVGQVRKIRGSKIAYLYGDEVVDWNREVFELLKSRLSLPYSCADLTGNPAEPTHYIKKFTDQVSFSIYSQHWELFDNVFLSKTYIEEICKEYLGTVYYDRYILGKWKRAEGIIYINFAANPNAFIIDECPRLLKIVCGIDFGGNKSKAAFHATGFTYGMKEVIILKASLASDQLNQDPEMLNNEFIEFANYVYMKYKMFFISNYDNAEPVLARGIQNAVIKSGCKTELEPAWKIAINQRIRLTNSLISAKRLFIMRGEADVFVSALSEAAWNPKSLVDERLDNGSSNIDSLDAFEYTIEKDHDELMTASLSERN